MRLPYIIDAGELRHSVTIEQPQYAADASGMAVTPSSYLAVRTTRAAVYTAGGRETSMASQIVSEVSHVVKVRWSDVVIKSNYRLLYGDRYFTVQYVEDVGERNRVLLLYCLEVDQGGAQ